MAKRARADLFRPVTTRSTVRNVVDQIVETLRAELVSEGEFLPSERTLASVMGVSRRTVREAIRLLSDAGVVEVLPGSAGGVRVVSIWVPSELAEESAAVPQADRIFEVLEARRTLEPRIAQLAGLRGTDDVFEAMQRSIDLQWSHQEDRRKISQMNARFHRLIWRAGGNETLESAMKVIYRDLEVGFDMTIRTPSDTTISIQLHERTLDALRRGDPEEIDKVMDEHLSYLEDICESVVGRRRVRAMPDFLTRGTPAPTP